MRPVNVPAAPSRSPIFSLRDPHPFLNSIARVQNDPVSRRETCQHLGHPTVSVADCDDGGIRATIRQTVEHPFGTIKSWMGSTHFQMKTLKHVSTEMALHVLAYNMKRVMSILGVGGLMEAIRA